ncbi:MAG TPA: ABC transporter permease, partial [Saprospiraceae bacterium]|nr:ABC transporter permease [Saprospiraceae bacterium]
FQSIWRPLIPYSHSSIDLKTGATVSPFQSQPVSLRMRHWLGTDIIGRDVMAGMIRGCRVSLMIGLGSMLLALLIGVPLGSAAAYWANRRKRFSFPVDPLVMGAVSVIDGFPGMFLILILVAILPFKGWLAILLVIALLRWPSMARYMRAEVFKMREMNYIKAAQLLNLPTWSILTKQIIPYAFRPIMVSFIFGISSAILAESSLSFLGIGLPAEQINWGRLLAQSRSNFDAWWLAVFPGLAVFFTIVSLYVIGNAIQHQIESVKE